MKWLWTTIGLFFIFVGNTCAADLVIFSGAGLIKPMEELRKNFEIENDIEIDVHYGSSGEIFGMLATGQPCDLLIPGAAKYTQDALKNGWVLENTIHNLVKHVPIIAVPKENPGNIQGLKDLARPGIKVAIGDPKAPAIGRVAKKILEKNKLWETVKPNIEVYAPTVNQLLIYVALKQVDASIIWEDLAAWAEGKGKVKLIPIAQDANMIKTIPTSICTKTANKQDALKFNTYIASNENKAIWEKWGFLPCGE